MILFNVDWLQTIGLLLGIVLPLFVGIVTKSSTNSGVKAILLAVIALVVNLLTGIQAALVDHSAYNLGAALLLGLGTFIIAVASHYGFWQPTGVTATVQNKIGPSDYTPAPAAEGKHL